MIKFFTVLIKGERGDQIESRHGNLTSTLSKVLEQVLKEKNYQGPRGKWGKIYSMVLPRVDHIKLT